MFKFALALIALVSPSARAETFVPFAVECSIFAHAFSGVEDIETDYKSVTLEGENDAKRGHKKVFEHGDYEFWVVTRETLQPLKRSRKNPGKVEVYAYDAEIRNKKTGVVAQARSAGKGEAHEGATYAASASLVTYPTGGETPYLVQGTLSLHCHHPKAKKKK
jgi:hypothetical protein